MDHQPRAECTRGHLLGRLRHGVPATVLLSLAWICAGCGAASSTLTPPPPVADFTLALSSNSISIAQGATSPSVNVSVNAEWLYRCSPGNAQHAPFRRHFKSRESLQCCCGLEHARCLRRLRKCNYGELYNFDAGHKRRAFSLGQSRCRHTERRESRASAHRFCPDRLGFRLPRSFSRTAPSPHRLRSRQQTSFRSQSRCLLCPVCCCPVRLSSPHPL